MHTTMKVKQNKMKINLFVSICIEHTCTKLILRFTGNRLKAGRIILHFKDMLDTALFKLYAIITAVFVNYAATVEPCGFLEKQLIVPIIAHIHKFHYDSLNPKTIRVDFSVRILEQIL